MNGGSRTRPPVGGPGEDRAAGAGAPEAGAPEAGAAEAGAAGAGAAADQYQCGGRDGSACCTLAARSWPSGETL